MANPFDFNNLGQRADHMGSSTPSPPAHGQHEASSSGHSHHSGNVTVYQTTGPDAHTGPMLAPGSSGTPILNPRSCVTCRRRKVRCDKQMPCSNCRRALIPCVFPAPGRAPRQPRPKDPNAPPKNSSQREVELTKRLRKLEGIVEELSTQIEVESSGKGPSTANSPADAASNDSSVAQRQMSGSGSLGLYASFPSPKDTDSTSENSTETSKKKEPRKQFGRLVLNDHKGSTRYVSSGFWSKLNDELDSIREETQRLTDEESDVSDFDVTPDNSPVPVGGMPYDHHSFILGYRSADVNLQKCHPLPSHVPFLWSVYQENVEPLLKILHVPSTELMLRDARKNSEQLSPGNEALAFSIYFCAIVSLEPDEVETNFGATKEELLSRYRFAFEQSIAKANFLTKSDFAVLQALTLFLIVVRRHDDSRFCWTLTGLVIRMAIGMGLHRDGSNFKLSPFETEMRRRLWWAILTLDLRSAEELGTDMSIGSFDTQMPININDIDISPQSTEFPEAHQGRSDMAVPMARYEICVLSRQLLTAAATMPELCPGGENEASIAERERLLIDVYERVEHKFLKHVVDEADPLYWVATMIARVIMAKMCLVIYQPMLFPGSEVELSDEIRGRIYIAAIEIIEYNQKLNTDPRCKQYRWLFMTYTSWNAIAYVLIESCRRPWTALVERGWESVQAYDKTPVDAAKNTDRVAVFLPLRKLFARCKRHRDVQISRLKANQDEARKLDFADRMNPAHARFGPVPGTENRMDQVREKWRMMVRPDGASPMPAFGVRLPTPVPPQDSTGESSASRGASLHPPPLHTRTSSSGELSVPMDLSNVAMDYMQEMIMKQSSINMTDLWPLNNASESDKGAASMAANQSQGVEYQTHMPDNDALRQQAMTLQTQPPREDHMPPYLWSDPFTAMNTRYDEGAAVEDTDMMGEEFDWQVWSQSIRGLEMESTQPQRGW